MTSNLRGIAVTLGTMAFLAARAANGQYYDPAPYYADGSQVFAAPQLVESPDFFEEEMPVQLAKPALKATPTAVTRSTAGEKRSPQLLNRSVTKTSPAPTMSAAPKVELAQCASNKLLNQTRTAHYPPGPPHVIGNGSSFHKVPICPKVEHILDVYPELEKNLKCECGDIDPNCKLRRWSGPNPPGVDPECIRCVQEPFICEECDDTCVDVVIHSCKVTHCDQQQRQCKDGKCISEYLARDVQEVMPCTAPFQTHTSRIVISYHPVYIEIHCPKSKTSNPGPPCN